MSPQEFNSKLKKYSVDIKNFFTNDLPDIVGIEATNHFKKSFNNQGFTDKALVKWKPRKTRYRNSTANNKPILTQSGELGNSITYRKQPGIVIVSTDKVYAEPHNAGTRAGRGKGFIMIKRQFMGRSVVVLQKIQNKSSKQITKILNK